MKKSLLYLLLLCSPCCYAYNLPSAVIQFPNQVYNFTVFYGESLDIPVITELTDLWGYKKWITPKGTTLHAVGGICPSLEPNYMSYPGKHSCDLKLAIQGNHLGETIEGKLQYYFELTPSGSVIKLGYKSPEFHVTVIPHPLSVTDMPIQEATLNQEFTYNVKSAVNFYDENSKAGKKPEILVQPEEQGGIRFDKEQFFILGKPDGIGTYQFQVTARNSDSTSAPKILKIKVNAHPRDRPKYGAKGKTYQTTLKANTAIGGDSDSVTQPLHIKTDKELTPRFNENVLNLPLMSQGQPYFYDFVTSNSIYPSYDQIPYEITFALGYDHPFWLKIVNNQLIAETVPDMGDEQVEVYIKIKNIPGGTSWSLVKLQLIKKSTEG